MVKKILKIVGLVVALLVVAGGVFVALQVRAFNGSMTHVYDIPPSAITRSTDPAALERGKHLAESLGACASSDCHGNNLAGGREMKMGPLGTVTAPNITPAGRAAAYSDGELARLLLHGVRKDGTSVRFMPVQDLNWWPDEDVAAVISYVRSVPAVQKPDGKLEIGLMAKVLDRVGMIKMDVARAIDHEHRATAPQPEPTPTYGAFVARACIGCHGEHLSGGPIPGAPPSLPIPKNITPDATGIKDWTFEDFDKLLTQSIKKDGNKVNPFMPIEALSKLNDLEKHALWAYLRSVPPMPFGKR